MKTLPRVVKWGSYDWRVMTPTGKNILGEHTFKTASIHKSKRAALKALALLH